MQSACGGWLAPGGHRDGCPTSSFDIRCSAFDILRLPSLWPSVSSVVRQDWPRLRRAYPRTKPYLSRLPHAVRDQGIQSDVTAAALQNPLPPCRRTGEPRLSAGIRWATRPYPRSSAFICVQSRFVVTFVSVPRIVPPLLWRCGPSPSCAAAGGCRCGCPSWPARPRSRGSSGGSRGRTCAPRRDASLRRP